MWTLQLTHTELRICQEGITIKPTLNVVRKYLRDTVGTCGVRCQAPRTRVHPTLPSMHTIETSSGRDSHTENKHDTKHLILNSSQNTTFVSSTAVCFLIQFSGGSRISQTEGRQIGEGVEWAQTYFLKETAWKWKKLDWGCGPSKARGSATVVVLL